MRKVITIFGFIVVSAALCACDNNLIVNDEPTESYTDSYVIEYHSLSGIEAYPYNTDDSAGKGIRIVSVTNGVKYGALSTDDTEKAMYEQKCLQHGDKGYDSTFLHYDTHYPHTFQDRDFVSIDIISDADFDTAHPTGASLNDLFYFGSSSPIAHIKSGYTLLFNWDSASFPSYYKNYPEWVSANPLYKEDRSMFPIYGSVSEMNAENLVLLGAGDIYFNNGTLAILIPAKQPEINKTHNLTITMTDTRGETFEASVTYIF